MWKTPDKTAASASASVRCEKYPDSRGKGVVRRSWLPVSGPENMISDLLPPHTAARRAKSPVAGVVFLFTCLKDTTLARLSGLLDTLIQGRPLLRRQAPFQDWSTSNACRGQRQRVIYGAQLFAVCQLPAAFPVVVGVIQKSSGSFFLFRHHETISFVFPAAFLRRARARVFFRASLMGAGSVRPTQPPPAISHKYRQAMDA